MDTSSIEQTAALMGVTLDRGADCPVEWLDFSVVNNCSDAAKLEKILTTLRSGREGVFPELETRTEEQLKKVMHMNINVKKSNE
jgi:hypothetical protein